MFQRWLDNPDSVTQEQLNRLEEIAYRYKLDNWSAVAYMRSAHEHYLRGDKQAYQFEKEIAVKKMIELAEVYSCKMTKFLT